MNVKHSKIISVILAAATLGIGTSAFADNTTNAMERAQTIVEDYKELRSTCASAKGDERRSCFKELAEANESYKEAKMVLYSGYVYKDQKTEVSFVE